MVKWSRRESNPRPLECHAFPRRRDRARPSATVRENRAFERFAQTLGDRRERQDHCRTTTRSTPLPHSSPPRPRRAAPLIPRQTYRTDQDVVRLERLAEVDDRLGSALFAVEVVIVVAERARVPPP